MSSEKNSSASGEETYENGNNEEANLLVNDNGSEINKNHAHYVSSNDIVTVERNSVRQLRARDLVAGAVGFTVGVGVTVGTFAGLSATSFWSNDKNTNTSLFCNNTINGTVPSEQPSDHDLRCAITGGMMINATLSGAAGVGSAAVTYKLVQKLFDCMSNSDYLQNSFSSPRI